MVGGVGGAGQVNGPQDSSGEKNVQATYSQNVLPTKLDFSTERTLLSPNGSPMGFPKGFSPEVAAKVQALSLAGCK